MFTWELRKGAGRERKAPRHKHGGLVQCGATATLGGQTENDIQSMMRSGSYESVKNLTSTC